MQEMLPIISGLMLGYVLASARLPIYVRVLCVLALATGTTVASGEFRLSWGFLLPDAVEVATACAATFFGVRAWKRYARSLSH